MVSQALQKGPVACKQIIEGVLDGAVILNERVYIVDLFMNRSDWQTVPGIGYIDLK